MLSAQISTIFCDALTSAIPEGALTVSSWAARYRYVSAERSARPGLWRNEIVPYLVGVMDSVNDVDTHEIILMKSSQVAGTEFGNNVIGYFIHIDPTLIQYTCENEQKAEAWSVESLAPMLRDSPELKKLIGDASMRDSQNKIQAKAFRGGHLAIGWATSPATLSSRPRRVMIFDEEDAFKATSEGDAVDLGKARTKTFRDTRKIIRISSPRDAATSTIEPAYENSDKRKYFVPCPHCEEFQILKWSNVKWDSGEPENAYYVCEISGCLIECEDKEEMLLKGKWIAEKPFNGTAGFWINELYSPFSTWGDMAQAFLAAKDFPDKLKVFVNTRLAETWKSDEKIEYADLSFHREDYDAQIPFGVKILTAGVDVQDDRLEIEVVGWGDDLENWQIEYRVIYGDPAGKDIWEELKEYLTEARFDADGNEHFIKSAALDSGGHHTNSVYRFCKQNTARKFFAVKGASVAGKPIISKPSIVSNLKVKLFAVGTEAAKDLIFGLLKKEEEGPGFCRFPATADEKYFQGLCSEKAVTKFVQGKSRRVWQKVSANARNEPLDCRVYALAALHIVLPNLKMPKKYTKKSENLPENPEKTVNFPEIIENTAETLTEIKNKNRSQWNHGLKFAKSAAGGFAKRWK
jgi:phage terminase large subunit GpA-like protein